MMFCPAELETQLRKCNSLTKWIFNKPLCCNVNYDATKLHKWNDRKSENQVSPPTQNTYLKTKKKLAP